MSWSQSVFSDMVTEVGWEDGELIVTFKKGRVYAYEGVPEDKAIELAKAPSVGQMLNSEIKGQYNFRRIR